MLIVADFIYEEYDGSTGYPIRFIDASLYAPKTLTWDIEGSIYHTGIIVHSFGTTGAHVVKLTAANLAGSHTKSEQITVA
jgi:PKD repeat protein